MTDERDTPDLVEVRTEQLPDGVRSQLVEVARALGDANRIEILHLLAVADGPVCVLDFEHHLGVAQSTASHHLKTLVDAGICDREPRGRWAYYRLRPEVLATYRHLLERLAQFPDTIHGQGR